jgi:hypothetical protein
MYNTLKEDIFILALVKKSEEYWNHSVPEFPSESHGCRTVLTLSML